MKNIVGQVPRGDNFFPRDKIVNLIYRRLDSGANVYMAAPRRVGKTAIMCHLEDSPRENYEFKYIITESVAGPIAYFRRLSDALYDLQSLSKRSMNLITDLMPELEKLTLATGVELKFAERRKVFEDFKRLIKGLDTQGKTVIIMVDEFPQTVENILRKHGEEVAEQFLQFNRELRQQANDNIRFILTGSIGLPILAEKLTATKAINDLNVVEIPPLNREEASQLIRTLLEYEKVAFDDTELDYLLDKLRWFVPFHVQLLAQELIDVYLETEQKVDKIAIDTAFTKIIDKRHDIYFTHYYSRLVKAFENESEHPFALTVLKTLTQQDELDMLQIKELADDHQLDNCSFVLRTLEFDGYIFNSQKNDETVYQFTSPVLRLWWQQYIL